MKKNMPSPASKFFFWLICILLVTALPACNLNSRNVTAAPTPAQSMTAESPIPSPTLTPTVEESVASPTSSPTGMPTLAAVSITAHKGNLYIRRGPDLAFNPVGVLMDGQTAQALRRDVLGQWVEIGIPGRTGQTGWISVQSRYSQVEGEVSDLPELDPPFWPLGASIRNCTYHEMQVQPGEFYLPGILSFPENEISLNPGFYTVHDMSLPGNPEVLEVQIWEGAQVDILKDGSGDRHKCPED